jgi:hypothetical protein
MQVRSRREFLEKSAFGFGAIALGTLLSERGVASTTHPVQAVNPLAPKPQHFPAKAKSVIFLTLQGGPSQVDTFDPKPVLNRLDGQLLPDSFMKLDLTVAHIDAKEAKLLGSRREFKKRGQSGIEISDVFENVSRFADDIAIVRSCYHETPIHGPALSVLNTGSIRLGHPSMGAWLLYGLGAENANLPAYVVMSDDKIRSSKSLFGSGFLPAVYQGTLLNSEGQPIENLAPPKEMGVKSERAILDQLKIWNGRHLDERSDDANLAARMVNFELAFRMQTEGPELIDISKEPNHVRKLYGLDVKESARFGRMCLLARRMVERGVRFVQLYNSDWDGHAECDKNHVQCGAKVDVPIAGLLADLKQSGLLDSTLVVCGGEFGRTPVMEKNRGRDHNPHGFSMWFAGGGIKGGKVIGATDELGFRAVEDRMHMQDCHATMLEMLGLDHKQLHVLVSGLEKRLTGVGHDGERNFAKRLLAG